jgi:hypothetical protein
MYTYIETHTSICTLYQRQSYVVFSSLTPTEHHAPPLGCARLNLETTALGHSPSAWCANPANIAYVQIFAQLKKNCLL